MSITLEKATDRSPFGGHNSRTFYGKGENGTVPERILMSRRYNNGARVSQEWDYFLRNNDLHELADFFQRQARRAL